MAILRTKNPETGEWEEVPVVAGKNGKSAYEYAKEGGFVGTEAEFMVKLAMEVYSKGEADAKFLTAETDPNVPAWAKSATKPTYNASEVGADASGSAASALTTAKEYTNSSISTHNINTAAHSDLRLELQAVADRLNAALNSTDIDLDQMAEIVAYIKANRDLIEQITTGKVSVSNIVDNLTTNVANKPLSAAQGVALKALIDAISVPTKTSELTNDSGFITGYSETDPTVPAWAKAASKPSYTADEVGARPNTWTPTADDVDALPTSGGTLTGAITLPNNVAIKSKDGSGTAQEVLRANGSNQIVLGAAGIWDLIVSYHGLVPATSAVDALDLGAGGRRWRNLFLSGSISDGTNSVKVSDIAKKNDIPTVPDKTENWTFTLEDGSTVTKAVYLK